MPGGKRRHKEDFDPHFAGTFMFRDPEEVFREFFGGSSFEDLFSGKLFMLLVNYVIPISLYPKMCEM